MEPAISIVIFMFFIVMNLIQLKIKIPALALVFGLITWVLCLSMFNDPDMALGNTFPVITMILSTAVMFFAVVEAKRV
jgi:hypothetical protein